MWHDENRCISADSPDEYSRTSAVAEAIVTRSASVAAEGRSLRRAFLPPVKTALPGRIPCGLTVPSPAEEAGRRARILRTAFTSRFGTVWSWYVLLRVCAGRFPRTFSPLPHCLQLENQRWIAACSPSCLARSRSRARLRFVEAAAAMECLNMLDADR